MKAAHELILFSDVFEVNKDALDNYGAFNVSLVGDLPLFIDPFLLFNSSKPEYQELHDGIIRYLTFLRDKSVGAPMTPGLLEAWYRFKEVKQTWLGFAKIGNRGSALGAGFARALSDNFGKMFSDYGDEKVTSGSHLEKLCLIQDGVGRDNISDFTTNLIKEFLLVFTQEFAKAHIDPARLRTVSVPKVRFNYGTEHWEPGRFTLPWIGDDYVILVLRDILSRDETWINRHDMISNFSEIPTLISDEALRAEVNNYFRKALPRRPKKKDEDDAARKTIAKYPQLIDYFIRYKEENGDKAVATSSDLVDQAREMFLANFRSLVTLLADKTSFYTSSSDTLEEARKRVLYLKHVIENNDGYRLFYDTKHQPIARESDLQVAYRFVWYGTRFDVNREVNNGRGPVDYKVSDGAKDSTLIEFKLASNSQLKRNLEKQLPVYEAANQTSKGIKVIMYFTRQEEVKVTNILNDLKLSGSSDIVLIDARRDNKVSASKA